MTINLPNLIDQIGAKILKTVNGLDVERDLLLSMTKELLLLQHVGP